MTEDAFAELVERFSDTPGVTPPEAHRRGFGSHALKVHGSIFAMLVRGHLVVKLPAARVRELIAEGIGGVFDANKGTPMREWLTVLDESPGVAPELATEALAFVATAAARRSTPSPG